VVDNQISPIVSDKQISQSPMSGKVWGLAHPKSSSDPLLLSYQEWKEQEERRERQEREQKECRGKERKERQELISWWLSVTKPTPEPPPKKVKAERENIARVLAEEAEERWRAFYHCTGDFSGDWYLQKLQWDGEDLYANGGQFRND
jgi:hypothetical protein